MAYLDIVEGFHAGTQVVLPDTAVLGRHRASFLCLPEERVSRQHARISRRGVAFVIEDLQSANGLLVQGQRLAPHVPIVLADGAEIQIGSTRMIFYSAPLPPSETPHGRGAVPVRPGFARAAQGDSLWCHLRPEEGPEPHIALTLDAAASMQDAEAATPHTADELRKALARLQTLCQVSTLLGTITEWETLLHQFLAYLFDLFPVAERAVILLREQDDSPLIPVAARVRHGTPAQQPPVAFSSTIIEEVLQHKSAILSYDALHDPRFRGHTSIDALAMRSMMCVPLLARETLLGLMHVDTDTTPWGFTEDDLQLLIAVSAQASIFLRAKIAERAQDELRRAQAAAEQAYQAKGLWLATMSHELRTPLNAILGYSDLLLDDVAALGRPTMLANLRKIHDAGTHILALIQDVLDLSKLEAGKTELHLETFDVPLLLDEVRGLVQPAVQAHANTLEVMLTNTVGRMHGDLIKVRQSLLNLLSNACKFTTRGRILLQVSRELEAGRAWYLFRVQDTGIGLTAEQLARLFQDFVQGDAATAQQYGGTGLGLAISRRYCQMMGGDITATSTWGEGATFTMRLPVEVRPAASPAAAEALATKVLPRPSAQAEGV
ncbi:MAG: ATP-binding protein [Candidatus Tectimicrobiota bacterium]